MNFKKSMDVMLTFFNQSKFYTVKLFSQKSIKLVRFFALSFSQVRANILVIYFKLSNLTSIFIE